MKLTVTDAYLKRANGTAKKISWYHYIRSTNNLNDALTGVWTEITNRINEIPAITSRIEMGVGQYITDILNLTARGIAVLKSALLTADKYTEYKVAMSLEGATDIIPMFNGFIERKGWNSVESSDGVAFTVYSAEDQGALIASERVSTQHLFSDSLASGVELQNISGLIVTNVNIANYEVTIGVHTIDYDYNDGVPFASFDGGEQVYLEAYGTYNLINAEGTQKVEVYSSRYGLVHEASSDKIIVLTSGQTLPYQFRARIGGKRLHKLLYNKIGIETFAMDSMQYDTWDGRKIVSYVDRPPENETLSANERSCILAVGTNLYIGVGNKVYLRNMTTDEYTLITTFTEGTYGSAWYVSKMFYNARNGHLWAVMQHDASPSGYNHCVRRVLLADYTYSDVDIFTGGETTESGAMDLVDYNYTGSSWTYEFIYLDTGKVTAINGATMGVSDVYANALIVPYHAIAVAAGDYRFSAFSVDTVYDIRVYINTSGVYTYDGTAGYISSAWTHGIYNSGENRIYYRDTGTTGVIHSQVVGNSSITDIAGVKQVYSFIIGDDGLTYLTGIDTTTNIPGLYKVVINILTCLDNISVQPCIYWQTLTLIGTTIYGLSRFGVLFMFDDYFEFYVNNAYFDGQNIQSSINQVLQAFNLVAKISPVKKAFVYKRYNEAGVHVTTGNTLALTVKEESDIVEKKEYISASELITINSESTITSYDGTNWGGKPFASTKCVDINNPLIPDKTAPDFCYYGYKFYSVAWDMYKIRCDVLPLFQYEPLDGCSVIFDTTKIVKTGSGVIYGMENYPDGSMEVEILM